MSTVISVENVSKAYQLGQIGGGTLKEDFARWTAKLRGKPDPFLKIGEEHHARHMGDKFWALDDVSFEVKEGEVLGIIGRNGAGKSTLLKILSQVTTPTSGEVKIKGRIASLLEVGTGFHPELTGRENVFLNGAILGMTKAEIRKKFDEIVAFSEIEEFIDTPVKRYSSGMYVRLAFAVAAHLEPEILIVDEVLAVGDAKFQEKCLGKMEQDGKNGRTIIFVSHQLAAVQRLCTAGILFTLGRVSQQGGIGGVLERYMLDQGISRSGLRKINPDAINPYVLNWSLEDAASERSHSCFSRENATFKLDIYSPKSIKEIQIGFIIRSLSGDILISANSCDDFGRFFSLDPGITTINVQVRLALKAGIYKVDLSLADRSFNILDQWIAEPLLTILPCEHSVLHGEWQGLINEPVSFNDKAFKKV
jgi:lipopolysaccharide transport system ATP-binding protein